MRTTIPDDVRRAIMDCISTVVATAPSIEDKARLFDAAVRMVVRDELTRQIASRTIVSDLGPSQRT